MMASKGDTQCEGRALSQASFFCLTSSMVNRVLLPCHFPWCPRSPPQGPLEMELRSDHEVAAGQSRPLGPLATSVRRTTAGVRRSVGVWKEARGVLAHLGPLSVLRHLHAAGIPRTF